VVDQFLWKINLNQSLVLQPKKNPDWEITQKTNKNNNQTKQGYWDDPGRL